MKEKKSPMYHIGIDYGILKRLSAGLSFGYQTFNINVDQQYYIGINSFVNNEFNYKWSRYHIAARGDFYIISRPKISLYTGLKFGYNHYVIKENHQANYVLPEHKYNMPETTINLHSGFSYYYKNKFGLNAELGIGSAIPYFAAIGITTKI